MESGRAEGKLVAAMVVVFGIVFYLPVGTARFDQAILEALHLARWYAREHVILCLLPSFLIAGAIAAFVSPGVVMKYLGGEARQTLAYAVASVSGAILAVCSCTVLPLFAGIYRMGAGLGPAVAFLYAGPAVNVLAILLTTRILGLELGVARAVGAVVFSVVIGVVMQLVFGDQKSSPPRSLSVPSPVPRPYWRTALLFIALLALLIFANWGRPQDMAGVWALFYEFKWRITGVAGVGLGVILGAWFRVPWVGLGLVAAGVVLVAQLVPGSPLLAFAGGMLGWVLLTIRRDDDVGMWLQQSWGFARQILPLLLLGVLAAGLLLGRPGHAGLIPPGWVEGAVGGNSWGANLFASVAGAVMYFATLTEVPILRGLLGAGMGKGPALALLLAGPALSLPNMIVIHSIMGTRRTVVYVALTVTMSTVSGMLFGVLFP